MYYIKRRLHKIPPRVVLKTKFKPNEIIAVSGLYRMYSINKDTGLKEQIDEKHNLIMSDVYTKIANAFKNTYLAYYYKIEHLGIGDDNTTPTTADTALGNETYRVPYVVRQATGVGVMSTEFYITDVEFSGTIEELGIFGGVNSTITAGTGNLLSHVLWSYSKSTSEELLVDYQLTVEAG